MSYVIDANAIKEFQEERINTGETFIQNIVEKILLHGSIYMDEGELIYQEWLDCASGSNTEYALQDWVDSLIPEGKILYKKINSDIAIRKKLKDYGVPQKDRKYIELAKSIPSKYIVTNDIDFHDPQKKGSKGLDAFKSSKKGIVCKLIKKEFNSLVLNWIEIDEVF